MRRPRALNGHAESERLEELSKLHRSVYEGRLVHELSVSKGWAELMLPLLKEEELRLIRECRFDPLKGDAPSVERLAFLNAYDSGKIAMMDFIESEMSRILNQGLEASKALEAKEARHESKIS